MARPRRSAVPLLLALAAAAVVAVLVWTVAGGPGGEPGEERAAAPSARAAPAPEIAEEAELASLPEEAEEEPAETEPEPARDERSAVDATSADFWQGGSGGSLRGSVVFPAGAPEDETLEVLALSSSLSPSALHGEEGLLSFGDELGPRADERVWSRSAVGPDGSFRVGHPAGAESVHLVLRGRYLYLPEPVEAEVGGPFVQLEPELGGRIVGRLRPPSPDVAVGGIPVRVATDELSTVLGRGHGMEAFGDLQDLLFERFTRTDEAGAFDLGGVPPSEEVTVAARPGELAHAQRTGVAIEAGRVAELELSITRGATVAGRVVGGDGDPVAGAEVAAHRTRSSFGVRVPGERVRGAETGEGGRFELAGVMPGSVRLVVERDGFLRHVGGDLELAEGDRLADVEVTLERGKTFAGRVVLPAGEPAEGARVRVEREFTDMMSAGFGQIGGHEGSARTDAEGRFEIDALADASFELRAEWEEEREDGPDAVFMKTLDSLRPGGPELRVELEPPMAVRGTVVDEEGAPVTAFRLTARKRSDTPFLPAGEREREEFESEDGTFDWAALHAGAWTIEADAEGFSTSEPVELELPSEEAAPLALVLPRTARVTGRVLSPDGAPVAGAEVTLHLDMMANLMRRLGQREVAEAESDGEGRFEIEVPPGEPALYARHRDWADSPPSSVAVASGGQVADVVLALRRGALLTGEVYDKEGRLASGVQIILQRATGADQRFAQSDRDGFFTFERVTPGDWQLVAMVGEREMDFGGEGFDIGEMMSNMHISMVGLEDGDEKHVRLGAPPADPVMVRGEVTAAEEPLGDVILSFFPARGSEETQDRLRMTQTDDAGRFQLQLDEPGHYVVNVQRMIDFTGQQQSVEFREDVPKAAEHHVEFEMPGGSIRGRVLDSAGNPLGGIRVSLTSSEGFAYGSLFGGQYADVRTDESGRYELLYLREGTYAVGAGGATFGGAFGDDSVVGRQVESGIRVAEGASVDGVDFRLDRAGHVQGVARDAEGKPVPDAAIFLRDGEGRLLELFSMVTTDGSGKFQYSGVAAGRYTVSAQTRDRVSASSAPVEVRSGETSRVELALTEGTTLLVSLVDKTDAEVEAQVRVKGPDGREWSGMMSMDRLMELMGKGFESAEQKVGPLPPGVYEVTAKAADGREASKKVSLSGQEERKVKLRLRD